MVSKKNLCLVTGADGFIGSHLTELLLDRGYKVRALSYYNSFNYWGWLEEIRFRDNLQVITGDIRDYHFVQSIMDGVDIVFHLAALIAIPYSYIAPVSYVETNINGTLNICKAAKETGTCRVIHTSTSEVYGTAQYVPIDEKHPKQPQSPYSASKIGADAIALSFFHSYGLPVTVARPFNTYGPRQSARAIIPTIITQIASGIKKIKLGDLRPTRDLNFVKDICNGFIALAESEMTIGKEINISSNQEISMAELAEMIIRIMGEKVTVESDSSRLRPENSEVYRLWGDNNLLWRLTAFKPEHTLEEGIKITIDWFVQPKHLAMYKSGIYNV